MEIKKEIAIFLIPIVLTFLAIPVSGVTYEWWNTSWYFRVRIEVNSTGVERTNWPIETDINFTKLIEQLGMSGTFDENSIRVIEYNITSGEFLYEIPYQFEKADNFNATSNAYGTLIFIANGTTPLNQKRIFYVYFDILENGQKEQANYSTQLSYAVVGDEIRVNTSYFMYFIDLSRGDYTTGIYQVQDYGLSTVFKDIPSNERTAEYIEYSNGTYNFTINASSFIITSGPVRIKIEIYGDEVILGNPYQKSGELTGKKIYYFYEKVGPQAYGSFILIEQLLNGSATRNSTKAGALAFDVNRTFKSEEVIIRYYDSSDPYSYAYSRGFGGEVLGVINLNETGTTNFYALDSPEAGRTGIHLNTIYITQISEKACVYFSTFGGGDAVSEFLNKILEGFRQPFKKILSNPEYLSVSFIPYTEYPVYNRKEEVVIFANITYDPYNLTAYLNATIDRGTPDKSDDFWILLYDNGTGVDQVAGDKLFTGSFVINESDSTGIWNITLRAYDSSGTFLGKNTTSFNVTNLLNVFVKVLNEYGLINRTINASVEVRNYRNDTLLPNCTIVCYFDETNANGNVTDYNNGTYLYSFKAPSEPGLYILTCNASRDGNWGDGEDTFSADDYVTYLAINLTPTNYTSTTITAYQSDWFDFKVKVYNTWNGTAYDVNVTIILPNNWQANSTFEECGLIPISGYCIKAFNITIPTLTRSGSYNVTVIAKWRNTDNSTNSTSSNFTVIVTSNPSFHIPETHVYNIVGRGRESILGNFTLNSTGNDPIEGIKFTVIGLEDFQFEFIPNITSLEGGKVQSIQINITIPAGYPPGNYSGILNVTTSNNGYDWLYLNVTVSGAKVEFNLTPTNYTSTTITAYQSDWFELFGNVTNIGNVTAFNSYFKLYLPANWQANLTYKFCGNISINNSCTFSANLTIPALTRSGFYLVNLTYYWEDIGEGTKSLTRSVNVTITSNPSFYIPENYVYNQVEQNKESILGNFTLNSTGNDPIEGIKFTVIGLEDFQFEFIPNITSLEGGKVQSIQINITIPAGYPPGNYSGILNVTTSNNGYDWLYLNVTVLTNKTWTMHPTHCEANFTVPEGLMCVVRVNNTGNLPINFTITPREGNKTWVNVTNFTLNPQESYVFGVYYNVTGAELKFYNSTFKVDALDIDASPDFMLLTTVINPYVGPLINVSVFPGKIEQTGHIDIYANITDRSGYGIEWVRINVTRPNGTIDSLNMTLVEQYDDKHSLWYIQYPGTKGDTSLRGIYEIIVYSKDKVGITTQSESKFYVYAKLVVFLSTYQEEYPPGSDGRFFYRVFDYTDNPLGNVSVTIKIYDSLQNLTYESNFTTNEEGYINPLPSFRITSDAPLGNYTLIAFSSYWDNIVNHSSNSEDLYVFKVSGTAKVSLESLYVDVETTVVWYPNNVMKFSIIVYNISGLPVDPEQLNLTVKDPAGNLYLFATIDEMDRVATGYYIYKYAMPSDTPTGAYTAYVTAYQDGKFTQRVAMFRVSAGGPYDVRIKLLEKEVSPGETLPFEIYIENQGEVSQDVDLEYWVEGANDTWYYASEAIYMPALSNKTLLRSVYIFSDQPLGTYYLKVKLTYDPVKPPILKWESFRVVTKVPVPVAPPPAPPAVPPVARLIIWRFPSEISIEGGWTRYIIFYLNNTGSVVLHKIELAILGAPANWFTFIPSKIELLEPGKSIEIRLKISPPKVNYSKFYNASLLVISNETTTKKSFKFNLFKSREELLAYEIAKLEKRLKELINQTDYKEKLGYDVSAVRSIIEEIKTQIKVAKDYLKRKKFDECAATLIVISNLIDRGFYLLSIAPKIKVITVPAPPLWLIILLISIAVVLIFVVFFAVKWKHKLIEFEEKIRPRIEELRKIRVARMPEEVRKERERLERVLRVLEREYREGLISARAYEELRRKLRKRLEELTV